MVVEVIIMKMPVKNNIKEYRVKNGYTQEQLARIIGVSGNTVSLYETGSFDPSLKVICRMLDTFNCTFEQLFKFESLYHRKR